MIEMNIDQAISLPENEFLTKEEVAIIRRLAACPMPGDRLRIELNMSSPSFLHIVERLWHEFYLRGVIEDGCCNAPCGKDCVSAFKFERVWQITDKGLNSLKS